MRHLRSQWGDALWARPSFSSSRTDAPLTLEVAIIGGGLTGVSAAYHLAKMGVRSVLFEAGILGDGASGRTGGLVLEGTAAGVFEPVDQCVPGLKLLVDTEGIDCDLSLPGCWEIEHRRDARRSLPWLDDGQSISITKTVSGGVVQPAALTIGIATAAQRLGATVYEESPATGLALEGDISLRARGEEIRPRFVIIATNAWINAIVPDAPHLHSSLTFACATAPLSDADRKAIGLGENIPFYTEDLPYLWGRTVSDGRVIFGAGLAFGSPGELESIDVHQYGVRSILDGLQTRVRGLNPALHEVPIEYAWAGPIAFAEDSLPLIGPHPANPRVLISGAYAGHGVALSVRAGELLARAIHDDLPLPKWASLSR